MSYTRKQWWLAELAAIGNPNPSQYVINYGIAWTQFETAAPPGAAYNLLNTTEPNTPGVVSDFNSVGVKNYDTFANGIAANAKVLRNGLYPELNHALVVNDEAALKAPDQAIMQELGKWGTGHASDIAALAGNAGALLPDQAFPGDGPTGPSPVVTPPTPVVVPEIIEPLDSIVVKIGASEDFKLVHLNGRFYVGLKHSSEAKFEKAQPVVVPIAPVVIPPVVIPPGLPPVVPALASALQTLVDAFNTFIASQQPPKA